ncbi:hypothetical protein Ddc_10579 [Ditylenchus destructor]|nr:hypothetical protein Ddc_10579 [Ditylenchus destructor]
MGQLSIRKFEILKLPIRNLEEPLSGNQMSGMQLSSGNQMSVEHPILKLRIETSHPEASPNPHKPSQNTLADKINYVTFLSYLAERLLTTHRRTAIEEMTRFLPEDWMKAYSEIPEKSRQCFLTELGNLAMALLHATKEKSVNYSDHYNSMIACDKQHLGNHSPGQVKKEESPEYTYDIFVKFFDEISVGNPKASYLYQDRWLDDRASQIAFVKVFPLLEFFYHGPFSIILTKAARDAFETNDNYRSKMLMVEYILASFLYANTQEINNLETKTAKPYADFKSALDHDASHGWSIVRNVIHTYLYSVSASYQEKIRNSISQYFPEKGILGTVGTALSRVHGALNGLLLLPYLGARDDIPKPLIWHYGDPECQMCRAKFALQDASWFQSVWCSVSLGHVCAKHCVKVMCAKAWKHEEIETRNSESSSSSESSSE